MYGVAVLFQFAFWLFCNVQHKALLQYLAVGRLQNIPAHFVGFHAAIAGNNTAVWGDICAEFCSRHLWCVVTTRFPNITLCIYILQSQTNEHPLYHSNVSTVNTPYYGE